MKISQIAFLRNSLTACLGGFLLAAPARGDTNLTVAADGGAQFKTVQEAVNATPQNASASNQVFIRIKPGVYKEVIYVQREKRYLHLVGENPATTILTFDLNANLIGPSGQPIGTFATASTVVDADDFSAENLTFENSAGNKGQALAIRIDGDRATFRNCRFLGWQDTILDNRCRHYYTNCSITGATDFIFGGATSFFESCQIHCLADSCITAASTPADQPFGFVFSNCKIDGDRPQIRVFLGRPWRPFASVTFLRTEMSEVIRPAGWDNWRNPANEKTARYAEYQNTGPGAGSTNRVAWSRQLSADQAAACAVENVLGGQDHWRP
jgi:pectinesterase